MSWSEGPGGEARNPSPDEELERRREEFDRMVDDAVEAIPEPYAQQLSSVAIVTEDEPGLGVAGQQEHHGSLLGLSPDWRRVPCSAVVVGRSSGRSCSSSSFKRRQRHPIQRHLFRTPWPRRAIRSPAPITPASGRSWTI